MGLGRDGKLYEEPKRKANRKEEGEGGVPLEIAIHDCEKYLEEQVDGVYKDGQ